MFKKRMWNKRAPQRSVMKISSTEKGADSIHYITLEDWFAHIESFGSAIILPEVKIFCQRMWWLNNLQRSLELRGKY